jgi:hypothetical protein
MKVHVLGTDRLLVCGTPMQPAKIRLCTNVGKPVTCKMCLKAMQDKEIG